MTKDLLKVLKLAKDKRRFQSGEFEKLLAKISGVDKNIKINWDSDVPEEWAFINKNGASCMINRQMGVIFICRIDEFEKIGYLLEDLEVVEVDGFDILEWNIDLNELNLIIPELCWHACADAVNPNCFSLNDLFYATV